MNLALKLGGGERGGCLLINKEPKALWGILKYSYFLYFSLSRFCLLKDLRLRYYVSSINVFIPHPYAIAMLSYKV